MPAYRYRFLRQGVTLTGLGSPTFTRALEAIKSVHSKFDRQFSEGALEAQGEYNVGNTEPDRLDIWNRYLTPAREARGMQSVSFLPGVDPKGTLRDMAQEDGTCPYVHTEDNQVHFYATHRDGEGQLVYVTPKTNQ